MYAGDSLLEEAKEYAEDSRRLQEKMQKEAEDANPIENVWRRLVNHDPQPVKEPDPEEKQAEQRLNQIKLRLGYDRDPKLTLWSYAGCTLFGRKMPTGVAGSHQVLKDTSMTVVQKYENVRDIVRKSQARVEGDGSLFSCIRSLWTRFFRATATEKLYSDVGSWFDRWDAVDSEQQQRRMKKS
jgi:hypothetical protein